MLSLIPLCSWLYRAALSFSFFRGICKQTTLLDKIQILYFVISLIPSSIYSVLTFLSGFVRSYQHVSLDDSFLFLIGVTSVLFRDSS